MTTMTTMKMTTTKMNANSFPLFTSLFNDTRGRHTESLSTDDEEFFLKHISDLDDNGREIFYAIIRQHHILSTSNPSKAPNTSTPTVLPPCCKLMKKGIRIDFDKIPLELKHMLLLFLRKYMDKLKEDATLFAHVPQPALSNAESSS